MAVSTGRGMDGPTEAIPQGRGHGRVARGESGCVDLRACTSGLYSTSVKFLTTVNPLRELPNYAKRTLNKRGLFNTR